MKRYSLFVAFLFACIALQAKPISLSKAKALAQPYMKTHAQQPLLAKKSASSNDENQPLYIFSRGEGQGFVIVSGDDAYPEILGYAETGDFIEDQMPPQLLAFIDHYRTVISDASVQKMPSYVHAAASDKNDIAPMIKTHWTQSAPYNNRCPLITSSGNRSIVGCVATAASQVIYYFHKDCSHTLMASTPTYNYGDAPVKESIPAGTPLKWELMQNSYNGKEPAEYLDAISTFCFAVGSATWLTYGSSTGGHIADLLNTFSSYYGLTAKHMYMSGTTQTGWENRIYDELSNGRPMVFSGYTSDWKIGHAIVLDGYQKSGNLFHFNFGWGGQADGFYTIVDGKGPGEYGTGQEIVYNIMPKKYNLSAEIKTTKNLYSFRTNVVTLKVANNGTLDYSGIYLFCNTNGNAPTKLSAAIGSDVVTAIPNDGQEVELTFSCYPMFNKDNYLFVTDKNLNIIAQTVVPVVSPESDLHFGKLSVKSSSDSDNGYPIVYNNKVVVDAEMLNKNEIPYEGTLKLCVYGSEDGGKSFNYIGEQTLSMTSQDKSNEGYIVKGQCSFSQTLSQNPLKTGTPYYISVQRETYESDVIDFDNATDTTVCFVLAGADLAVTDYSNRCLSLKGHWDETIFNNLTQQNKYADALTYDLSEVESIVTIPDIPSNPNALFYVAKSGIEGNNVIIESECDALSLIADKEYVPLAEFNAKSVKVDIEQIPNKWYLFTSPSRLTVPNGMLARSIDRHMTSGITGCTTDVKTLEPGRTYLLVTSSSEKQTLTSDDSTPCLTQPVANTDAAVVGTFVSSETPDGAMTIDMADDQYFRYVDKGTEVKPFRGYFLATNIKKEFRANSDLIFDQSFNQFGKAIEEGYQTLKAMDAKSPLCLQLINRIDSAEVLFSNRDTDEAYDVDERKDSLLSLIARCRATIVDTMNVKEDYTDYIVNPSFELGNTSGWTLSASYASAKRNSTTTYRGVGADGEYLLYNCNTADQTGCMIQQTIEGLPDGIYSLTAMLGTDPGNTVVMFANDMTTECAAHPFGKYYLSKAVIEGIEIRQGQPLVIGVNAGSWYKADDFRLRLTGSLPAGMPGDANNDGVIDVADITTVASIILGTSPDGCNLSNADANMDGYIDIADITTIAAIILN